MECFILRFSASWNYTFKQPFTMKLQLTPLPQVFYEVSSNFLHTLLLTFHVRFLKEWFIQKCSPKLISNIELCKSKTSLLRDGKSFCLFFYSKTDKFVDEIIHRIIKCVFSESFSPKFQKLIILGQNNRF